MTSVHDGRERWTRQRPNRHEPESRNRKPAPTFDELAGDKLACGRARYAARHGDHAARDRLREIDTAYTALANTENGNTETGATP